MFVDILGSLANYKAISLNLLPDRTSLEVFAGIQATNDWRDRLANVVSLIVVALRSRRVDHVRPLSVLTPLSVLADARVKTSDPNSKERTISIISL